MSLQEFPQSLGVSRAHPRTSWRGDTTLALTRHNLGLFGALAIIGLRLTIGFHFLNEGLDKFIDPKPFTGYFLASSKGPLAPWLKSYIWDPDGLVRLGYVPGGNGTPRADFTATEQYWNDYAQRVARHHRFSEQQAQQAGKVLAEHHERREWFAQAYQEDLTEYFRGIERRDQQMATPSIRKVESLRGQAEQWQADVKKMSSPLLKQVDGMWSSLERELNAVGAGNGKAPLPIGKLGRTLFDSEWIDGFIPWFDVTIGICLILGLFTRVAGLAGAGFLATVIATQWPGATGAIPTWFQATEMFALLTLVAVNAGQYGGLDFFCRALRAKCCPASRGT